MCMHVAWLVRLRTGEFSLNQYLHRFGIEEEAKRSYDEEKLLKISFYDAKTMNKNMRHYQERKNRRNMNGKVITMSEPYSTLT